MDFNEFLILKDKLLKQNPNLINWAENNLYNFFEININIHERKQNYYRCHLVEDYLKMMNIDDHLKQYVGASNGVRQSLELLMHNLDNWEIPVDVYPFYVNTLSNITKVFNSYQTLHNEELFNDIQGNSLLICYPLKPMGRNYSKNEIENLRNFLSKDSKNTLIIDMVYWMNFSLPEDIFQLYKSTNQVIICHSLSKMFLKPNTFGITLLPNNELGMKLRNQFINLGKDESKLHLAFNLIKHNQNNVKQLINSLNNLSNPMFDNDFQNPSYLFYSEISHEDFLKKGILTIPESVFGGKGNGSIISCLVK